MKEISITNSELARITRHPISKVRRNTKEFLPPDPQASRRSGYSRKFNLDDAYKVYIGTYLVSTLAYSFPDARTIIVDLWPWAASVNLLPGGATPRTGIDKDVTNYTVQIRSDAQNSGFHYTVDGDIPIPTDNMWTVDPVRGRVKLVSKQTFRYEYPPKDRHAVGNKNVSEHYINMGDRLIFEDHVFIEVTRVLPISQLLRSFNAAMAKL
jgi:hypothetical protein